MKNEKGGSTGEERESFLFTGIRQPLLLTYLRLVVSIGSLGLIIVVISKS